MMTALVQVSKREPSLTALRMPSGIEIGVGEERHPQAERDRHRHLLADQLEDADVAEIALAEIEAGIVPQHQAEALERRLVEAELLLELLDELRVEPLRAAIFRGDRVAAAAAGWRSTPAKSPPPPAMRAVAETSLPWQLRDDPLDRPAGRELHDGEADRHDPDQVGMISRMRRRI